LAWLAVLQIAVLIMFGAAGRSTALLRLLEVAIPEKKLESLATPVALP
jgi:hypothetical protein